MARTRGPVPKRSDQRRRTNADSRPEKLHVAGPVVRPLPIREDIHPLAAAWYSALAESGQSRYYEPSDWMMAQIIAEGIEEFLETKRAGMLETILSGAASLLATEGDRRRLRVELERDKAADPDEVAADATVTSLMSRLAGDGN